MSTRSGWATPPENSATGSAEVLLLSTTGGGTRASRRAKTSRLTAGSSVMLSATKPAPAAAASSEVVKRSRPSRVCGSIWRSPWRCRASAPRSARRRDRSSVSWWRDINATSGTPWARITAMPVPISPAPITAAFWGKIGRAVSVIGGGLLVPG